MAASVSPRYNLAASPGQNLFSSSSGYDGGGGLTGGGGEWPLPNNNNNAQSPLTSLSSHHQNPNDEFMMVGGLFSADSPTSSRTNPGVLKGALNGELNGVLKGTEGETSPETKNSRLAGDEVASPESKKRRHELVLDAVRKKVLRNYASSGATSTKNAATILNCE